ncbi:MAG TPA: hypothetical protein VGR62_10895 [Candidatus Binatia bacterium]|jgi:hypothetical protein|nr:hypothetical protein [Candidatus Binatia bacterium]
MKIRHVVRVCSGMLVGMCVAVGLSLAGEPPPAADVPLPGTSIKLADTSGSAGRRAYVALRDTDGMVVSVDPTVSGARVYLGQIGSSDVTVLDLPADGWSGHTGKFKFKSRTDTTVAARLVDGRAIRLTAFGPGAMPLGGAPQGEVGVIIEVGSVRFCGVFGGTVKVDDGVRFRARRAPAPAECPALGTPTTTTTTIPACTAIGGVCDLSDPGACCSQTCCNGSPTPTCCGD